jgi:hypothetical protein
MNRTPLTQCRISRERNAPYCTPPLRHSTTPPPPHRARRGAAYALVVGVAFLATVMGLSVLLVSQYAGRNSGLANDSAEAEALAQSAIEYAMTKTSADPLWRYTYLNNQETAPIPLGRGTIAYKFVDPADGDLTNNNNGEPVRVYGIGRVGRATRIYSVSMASTQPLNSLLNAMDANGNIDLGLTTLTGSGTLSSNGTISAISALLNGLTMEAVNLLNLGTSTGSGGRKSGITPRSLPDPVHAFDWYLVNGTVIPITALPGPSSAKLLKYRLFSPASNPFGGPANPYGVYVIDCQGVNVQVSQCRVVGTLVLLNTTTASTIQGSNYFVPSTTNAASLMVRGDITISMTGAALADNGATGDAYVSSINYNPPGTPYNGGADATFATTYPSEIDGAVYISGNLQTSSAPAFVGSVLVGSGVSSSGSLSLNYSSVPYNSPPAGFKTSALVPIQGTWVWEAAN